MALAGTMPFVPGNNFSPFSKYLNLTPIVPLVKTKP